VHAVARVLLNSGSTRSRSTNTALLRTAQAAPPGGVEPVLYGAMTGLAHFNPDDDLDPLPPAVVDLREQIGSAVAVLFCTPEYAGAAPSTPMSSPMRVRTSPWAATASTPTGSSQMRTSGGVSQRWSRRWRDLPSPERSGTRHQRGGRAGTFPAS
jgi:hypothetical protein